MRENIRFLETHCFAQFIYAKEKEERKKAHGDGTSVTAMTGFKRDKVRCLDCRQRSLPQITDLQQTTWI
jgi:hypothetical protein